MKVGDKVTVYKSTGHRAAPLSVTVVVEVKARQYVTEDGRRWRARGAHDEVDAKNQSVSSRHIAAYRDGDEDRIIRYQLLVGARKLLAGHQWEVERDIEALLSNDDLRLMGEISERLEAARKARKSES